MPETYSVFSRSEKLRPFPAWQKIIGTGNGVQQGISKPGQKAGMKISPEA